MTTIGFVEVDRSFDLLSGKTSITYAANVSHAVRMAIKSIAENTLLFYIFNTGTWFVKVQSKLFYKR